MLADSFRHQIKYRIQQKKHLYDFDDSFECADSVKKATFMAAEDLFDFKSHK